MIGTLLNGRFRLETRLGSGGMSTVYRAFDETLERWVAIKLMHRDISSDPDQLERFSREARAVARLSSPNVVTVIDAGEDEEGHPYIVFECIEGETLKERIRRMGRLPVDEAVAYAIEIGRALSAAHAERIVHRDVKPQNVLISADGRAKVTDFGIARSLEAEAGLTAAGRVLGTTDYVSPEQALGHDVGPQTDLYSLGICLYEMLTGEVPFKAESQVAVAMKHVREPLPDVQRVRPEVSSTLAAIVDRATAKEPRNRYQTADEMVHDLEQALAVEVARSGETHGEATTVLRTLPGDTSDFAPARLRRPGRWIASIAAFAIAMAAVLAFLAGGTRKGTTGGAERAAGALDRVQLAEAHDYDPAGDEREHPNDAELAIDENRSSDWSTESYSGGGLQKQGVGLYVEARSAAAARRLTLITSEPGWQAEVYAARTVPPDIDGWTRVAGRRRMSAVERIPLDTGGRRHRYYLVWIVALPPGEQRAAIQEMTLLE